MGKEAFYFSHDSNARQDEKILALRMKLGWEGYGLFWAIIEKLREGTSYYLSRDYNMIAFDLRTDAKKIKSIVEDFRLFEFTEDGKYFYSERLKQSMILKDEKSKKARESVEKRWEKHKEKNEINTNVLQSNNDANTIKEKKSKESKVNTIKENIDGRKLKFSSTLKPFLGIYGKELLNDFYRYWTEPNKSNTKFRMELERTWDLERRLQTWAKNDTNFNKNERAVEQRPKRTYSHSGTGFADI